MDNDTSIRIEISGSQDILGEVACLLEDLSSRSLPPNTLYINPGKEGEKFHNVMVVFPLKESAENIKVGFSYAPGEDLAKKLNEELVAVVAERMDALSMQEEEIKGITS